MRRAILATLLLALVVAPAADAVTARQRARAQALYEQTWGRTNPYLGGSRMSPLVRWGAPGPYPELSSRNYVAGGEDDIATLYASPAMAQALGRRLRVRVRGGGRLKRKRAKTKSKLRRMMAESAKGNLLHEWAHVYQDRELALDGTGEGGADLFKKNTGARIGLGQGWDGGYYPDSHVAAFVQKYGPDAWRREQFGDRWGKNPRTLTHSEGVVGMARNGNRSLRRAERSLRTRKDLRRARRAIKRYKRR